jgi:hypothetical protein
MSSCTLSYLNKTNLPLSEKERLTELHNQIFEELKQSKYLRKYKGQLVMPKHGYDVRWASADIKRVNEKYGDKVVSVIYDRSDKYFKAMVDVLKLVNTPALQIDDFFKNNPEEIKKLYDALGYMQRLTSKKEANLSVNSKGNLERDYSDMVSYFRHWDNDKEFFIDGDNLYIRQNDRSKKPEYEINGKEVSSQVFFSYFNKYLDLYNKWSPTKEQETKAKELFSNFLKSKKSLDILSGGTLDALRELDSKFTSFLNAKNTLLQLDITMQAGNQYFVGGEVFPTYEDAQSFKEKVEQEYVQMEMNRLFEAGELQIDCNL